MQRCRTCEATMTPTELTCISCGTPVPPDKPKFDARARLFGFIKYFMFACAAMTVLSLFMNVGPSFMTCAIMTLVLGLVRSSADEMMVDQEKK
jgi:hypothetical protein